jgi:hypothetical protein
MGQPKSLTLRYEVVKERAEGLTYGALADRHKLSYNTVKAWCDRFVLDGDQGLKPHYSSCGRKVELTHVTSFRLVRLISHLHPEWGIPLICCKISRDYPDLPLQSVRHYQRQIRRRGKKAGKPTLPKQEEVDRARTPHEVWQIDAKERISLKDEGKSEVCFLNITDEKTCALLHAKAFPPRADISGSFG